MGQRLDDEFVDDSNSTRCWFSDVLFPNCVVHAIRLYHKSLPPPPGKLHNLRVKLFASLSLISVTDFEFTSVEFTSPTYSRRHVLTPLMLKIFAAISGDSRLPVDLHINTNCYYQQEFTCKFMLLITSTGLYNQLGIAS